jgi:hypothetical protein
MFRISSTLLQFLSVFAAMGDYQCNTCERFFGSQQAVSSHCNALGHYPTWDCEMCSAKFNTDELLEDHEDEMHRYCTTCSRYFVNRDAILQHYNNSSIHAQDIGYFQCDRTFISRHALQQHNDTNASGPKKAPSPPANKSSKVGLLPNSPASALMPRPTTKDTRDMATQTTIYRCDECDENFDDHTEFQNHQNCSPFHDAEILNCHECNIKFENQSALLAHLESKSHKSRWVLCLI